MQRYSQCHFVLHTVWVDEVNAGQLGVLASTNSQQAIHRAPSYCGGSTCAQLHIGQKLRLVG
jgi:hypothetical protein